MLRFVPLRVKRPIALALADTRIYHSYTRRFKRFDYCSVDAFIHAYSKKQKGIFFIQVGGNDGKTWDPYRYFIQRDGWRGIVIEPQKDVFENRLKVNYARNSNVRLMNVAVDAKDGSRPLYKYAFSTSRWATGLASFDRDRLIKTFSADWVQEHIREESITVSSNPDEYLTSELVPCVSFETILAEAGRESIDFVLTDVEGFDVYILNTFPLDRVRPKHIVFELTETRDQAFLDFINKLRAHDYEILLTKTDAIAVLRE
jgi:FkbM family methyltransferase